MLVKFQGPTAGKRNDQSFKLLKDKLMHIKKFKCLFEQKVHSNWKVFHH